MTDLRKAAEQALEALEEQWEEHEAIDALRQALAESANSTTDFVDSKAPVQPEQESVICRNIYEVWAGSDGVPIPETIVEAYLLRLIEQMRDEASKGLKALYTAPPKKKWVGLTVNEARMFYEKYTNREELIYAIDEFLEEKNT